jgi:amino acid transporter
MLILSTLFSIQDIEELVGSEMPVAIFFLRATNRGFTCFFLVILLLAQLTSMCNSLVASAQLMWSMSRDGCIPYSKFLYKLSGKDRIPMRCMMVQMFICIIVILPVSCISKTSF